MTTGSRDTAEAVKSERLPTPHKRKSRVTGDVVVEEGEPGDAAFILVEGHCDVFKRAGELGILGAHYPEDVGGGGGPPAVRDADREVRVARGVGDSRDRGQGEVQAPRQLGGSGKARPTELLPHGALQPRRRLGRTLHLQSGVLPQRGQVVGKRLE